MFSLEVVVYEKNFSIFKRKAYFIELKSQPRIRNHADGMEGSEKCKAANCTRVGGKSVIVKTHPFVRFPAYHKD